MRTLSPATVLLLFFTLTMAKAPAQERSLSLTQYIDALQQLRHSVMSSADTRVISSLVQNLPPEWRVHCAGRIFSVSTHGIDQALRDYDKQRTPSKLAELTSQLDMLLADARAMQSSTADMSGERNRLTEILSRHEFRRVRSESWYDRLKQRLQRWLANLLERIVYSSAFPVVSRIAIWGLLALALAVAVFWVVRNYRQGNIYTQFTAAPEAISAKPWRDWHAEAEAAAREGRWRDAIHLSYWAAISFLEGQGLWRPDLARTPREYLKLLPQGDAHRDSLQQLTRSFETVWYGTEAATAETFAGTSALLERLGCR